VIPFLRGTKNPASVLSVLIIALVMFTSTMPLLQGSTQEGPVVLAPKTLERNNDPVVLEGSDLQHFNNVDVSNIYVWAYRGGDWQQVVFQIDQVNGMWEYDLAHKMYQPDASPTILDSDDELCFMAGETGDQVDASQWAPGADTTTDRLELEVTDPITSNKGWAYIFYHSSAPSWTTASYVSWNEATNTLTAENYTMDYPDNDARYAYFEDLTINANGGGDGGEFIDREKILSTRRYLFFTQHYCEQEWETQWAGDDDDGVTSENGVAIGPVRLVRHWRMGWDIAGGSEWGEKKSYNVFYYKTSILKKEHGKFWGSTTHMDDRNSIDHVLTTPAASYWDNHGNTATLNGVADDSYTNTNVLSWYQVSSPHGSYVMTCDKMPSPIPGTTESSLFYDGSGINDNDGGRTGASAGKFGDIAMDRMVGLDSVTQWDTDYWMFLLPASLPNSGSEYYDYSQNEMTGADIISTPQSMAGEAEPPATSSVLIEGLAAYVTTTSTAGTVQLTAIVDDTGRGDANIAFANYTIGFSAMPGIPTTAVDLAFDEVSEPVEATIDISAWPAGVYEIYVYGTDVNDNLNTTSTEHATITINDDQPPITVGGSVLVDGLVSYSTPLSTAGIVDITATIDDTGLGDSNIASAEWTVGFANFPGVPMTASDTAFDEVNEDVTYSIDLSTVDAGTYDVYVYGTDAGSQQNTTSTEHATVQIIDDVAPDIQNLLVEGAGTYIVSLTDAFTATITGTVSDDSAGGSMIAGANITLGADNWPSSQTMAPDDILDTDIEGFSIEMDISNWLPGTYQVFMYGWDNIPNYNLAGAFVTIIITNDVSPEIKNVLLDGLATLNVPFSARGTATLTGTVDDWGHGDLTIDGANYTMGQANWPGANMNPADILDSPYENFTASIDISDWVVGNYDFYMYGWDIANDYNSSSTEHATLVIFDDLAPIIQNVQVDGGSLYETSFSAAGTVTLTGTANDTDYGNSLIGGANYTVGQANWPGIGMTPDTALDSSLEGFSQTIDISAWAPGTYDLYVYGWDTEPNYNDDSMVYATIIIHDDLAPEVQDVLVNGSASFSVGNADATEIILTALIDDATHGSTSIDGANYTIGFINWPSSQPMIASDSIFNQVNEDVEATIDISSWQPGTYDFYVYGWDSTPIYNITSTAHATLTITDTTAPEIYNFLVDGGTSLVTDLDGSAAFTGLVDDTNTGGSFISMGFFTDGYQEWNSSFVMTNDSPLDSPVETFTEIIDFSDWAAGVHDLFMVGSDFLDNSNITSQENVTVTINDNKAPITSNWITSVNDEYQIWLDGSSNPLVFLNSTVSDAGLGYSFLTSVNWTMGEAVWPGIPMSPIDSSFDNYTEDVTAVIDTSGWLSGTYKIYVYGTDSWGNGQDATSTYAIINIDLLGPEVESVLADGVNPYEFTADDSFQLTSYGDDRDNGGSIITAAEFFVDAPGADGTGTAMSPIGFKFDSAYEGAKAAVDCSGWAFGEGHTYYVHFLDARGHWGEYGTVFVVKALDYSIPIHLGWNLISIPMLTPTTNLDDVLSDISWDRTMTFDPLSSQPWLSNVAGRSFNEFDQLDHKTGIWVHVTALGDGLLDISGALTGTTNTDLYAGWNLVGYPTMTPQLASISLAGTGADIMSIYNGSAAYLIEDRTDLSTVTMNPGEAYWVHVPADTVWTVDW